MNLETFERRRLLSVSVQEGYPGFYEVHGDDAAQVIEISVSAEDSSFTLDGVRYSGVSYISVFAYGGDDVVSVVADRPGSIAAGVDAGAGDDRVTVSGGGAVWGGSGADTLRLIDCYRGEIYGEDGNDQLYVGGECADAAVEGGAGADLIDATGSAYSTFLRGGGGDDTVYGSHHDDEISGDAGADLLVGNGGNDVFYAADAERDRIIGGAGVDVAYADAGEGGLWGVEYVFYA